MSEETKDTAFDAVSAWLSNAKSTEQGFLSACYQALSSFAAGNRDPLSKMLSVTQGKKAKRLRVVEGAKLIYAAPLKRICQHVIPNATAKHNPNSDFGMAWTIATGANSPVDMVQLDKLQELAQEGFSPFSKTFKEAFPPKAKEAPAKEQSEIVKAKAKMIAKWCEDNGIPLSVLFHAAEAKPSAEVEPAH